MTEDDEIISVGTPVPQLQSFEALDRREAKVAFRDGRSFVVDLAPALNAKRIFHHVAQDDDLFRMGAVDVSGSAIDWGDDAELSALWIERLAQQQGVV